MARGLSYLRDQAIRLRRTKWSGAPPLANELWLILQGIDPPVESVATTDEDGNLITIPFLDIPTLDLTPFDLDFPDSPVADYPTVEPVPFDPDTPVSPESPGSTDGSDGTDDTDSVGTVITNNFAQRSAFPGKVLSRSGNSFSVRVYPNHSSSSSRVVTATTIDSAEAGNVQVGSWTTVFMLANYSSSITQFGGASTGSLSASSVSYVINPGPSSASVWPGKIVSGSGDSYVMDVYMAGLENEATQVTVKQLQIDGDSEIPEDSWALVARNDVVVDDEATQEYTMQVPVWL